MYILNSKMQKFMLIFIFVKIHKWKGLDGTNILEDAVF